MLLRTLLVLLSLGVLGACASSMDKDASMAGEEAAYAEYRACAKEQKAEEVHEKCKHLLP